MVTLSLKARLSRCREADIVENSVSSCGGNDSRMASSTWAKHALGFLDARAGGSAHVQAELAGVHVREEVAADEGRERRAGTPRTKKQAITTLRWASEAASRRR